MAKRREPQTVVAEDELTDMHPGLWRAQSLCTILRDFVENNIEGEQTRLDIHNTISMVNDLIESAHNQLNSLEERAVRGKREAA